MTKIKLLFFVVFFSFLSLGCEELNGNYSSMEDSDVELFVIGKNNFVEINSSANQIRDKVNIILYQKNNINSASVQSKFFINELTGTVNNIDFKQANKVVYFGADEMEFNDFDELSSNKQLMEYSGNPQYYFIFNRSIFKNIKKLDIDLKCKVKSDLDEFSFTANLKMKRNIRVQIHP